MNKINREFPVDRTNYLAIEWLEKLGNDAPTEWQINVMETLLLTLSALPAVPIEYNQFKERVNA